MNIIQHGVGAKELVWRRLAGGRNGPRRELIDLVLEGSQETSEAGAEIFSSGRGGTDSLMLIGGIVGEQRLLQDGRRQILALRLPGEALLSNALDSMVALTGVTVVDAGGILRRLLDRSEEYDPLRRSWAALSRTDQAMMRDHIVRLGRMSAFERTGHFMLEIHERLSQVGLVKDAMFHLPLKQETLSDIIGLSVVHLNRTLGSLRKGNLLSARHGYFTLIDRPELIRLTGYVSRFATPWRPSVAGAWRRPAQVLQQPELSSRRAS